MLYFYRCIMKNQLSKRVFVLMVVNFNKFGDYAEIIDFDAASD